MGAGITFSTTSFYASEWQSPKKGISEISASQP